VTIFDEMYEKGYLELLHSSEEIYAGKTTSFKISGTSIYVDVYPPGSICGGIALPQKDYHWFKLENHESFSSVYSVLDTEEIINLLPSHPISKFIIFNLDQF